MLTRWPPLALHPCRLAWAPDGSCLAGANGYDVLPQRNLVPMFPREWWLLEVCEGLCVLCVHTRMCVAASAKCTMLHGRQAHC